MTVTRVAFVALLATASALPAQDGSRAPAVAAALQRTLDSLRAANGFPGATAAFVLGDGRSGAVATGFADLEDSIPMRPESVMLAGSAGKSFVAALMLSLAHERRVDVDAKIGTWFVGDGWFDSLPNARDLTLRMLLNHSSGISADYVSLPPIVQDFVATITNGTALQATHEEMVCVLAGTPAAFPAGAGYAYADGNYLLAALAAERITGQTYYHEVQRRFLDAPELRGFVPQTRRIADLAAGYEPEGSLPAIFPTKLAVDGVLAYDPAIEWAGGGFATTASSLAHWAALFYGGKAVGGDYRRVMLESLNGVRATLGYQYGIGIQVSDWSLGEVYFHGGGIFGYAAVMAYFPGLDLAVALQINTRDRAYIQYVDALSRAVATAAGLHREG